MIYLETIKNLVCNVEFWKGLLIFGVPTIVTLIYSYKALEEENNNH